jgi:hypothetical protein
MLYSIIWGCIVIFFLLFFIFLFFFERKIHKLENKIEKIFQSKNNLIPALFEITKNHLVKHEEIFHELLILKKLNFSEHNFYENINKTIHTQQRIHKEMDFIFRVCHKHQKLIKDYNFYYIKELLFTRINDLWDSMSLYKKMVKKYNFFLNIKNYTVIWLFIPMRKKEEI